MNKLIIVCLAAFALSGCIRKMNIQQGNIIEPASVSKLHTGMSMEEVKKIMGTPLLMNTFNDNRVDYVYTDKPGGKKMTEHSITLIFKNNRLQQISDHTF